MKLASRLVHFDPAPDDPYAPVSTPIYLSATYDRDAVDQPGTYDYARSGNPTWAVLESLLASVENATHAACTASGMAAIAIVTRLLSPGDEILADIDLYGGSWRYFERVLPHTGVTVRYADARDAERFAEHLRPNTRLVYVESPTNPMLRVLDLRRLAALARGHKALFCVDNSTMSPYLQNPLDLGADIVVHSGTKYLGGHHDVTGGAILVKDDELGQRIGFLTNAEGNALSPFDSFLMLRGLKTLKIRMDAQQRNAEAVARFLAGDKRVQQVFYPGLPEDEGYELHRTQARGAGAVMSFTTGSVERSKLVASAAKLFRITVSFGSVSSSISLPSRMSHASIPTEILAQRGLPADLLRLSIGIEDPDDLIADLDHALAVACAAP